MSYGAPEAAAAPEADPSLTAELTRTVRRWARPTTPSELAARGVERVHAVSLARVGALLEKAVNRALIRRTLDGMPDDALALSASAREEFLRLTRGGPQDTERITARASSTLDRLKNELARRRAALEVEAKVPHTLHDLRETAAVEERVRELFVRFSRDAAVPLELEKAVVGVVREAFDDVQRVAREARQREHRRELELLERRIQKLQALLAETEAELSRVRDARDADPGAASIYDRVQGLDPRDSLRERKGALMAAIFAANLEMRQS